MSPLICVFCFNPLLRALAFLIPFSFIWGLIGIQPQPVRITGISLPEAKEIETGEPIVMVVSAANVLAEEERRGSKRKGLEDQPEANVRSEKTALRIQPETENFSPALGGTDRNSTSSAHTILEKKLETALRDLEVAESEKALLLEEIRLMRGRAKVSGANKTIRDVMGGAPAIRGKVLAFNRSLNCAVLSLGAIDGVETNSEMLVFRGRGFICKIRISSVEPTMAIGDIIGNSLGKGAQMRIGDTVIYAGKDP